MTAQVKGYIFSLAPLRQKNKYVYKNIMSKKRRRESVNRATTDKSSWQDIAMLNMTLIKGDDDSNNDDNNKPVRAFQFNVPETAFTNIQQSASVPNFLRRFCDSWIKCPAKVINIRSMQKKKNKSQIFPPRFPWNMQPPPTPMHMQIYPPATPNWNLLTLHPRNCPKANGRRGFAWLTRYWSEHVDFGLRSCTRPSIISF